MTTRSLSPSYLSYSDIVDSKAYSEQGYMDYGLPDVLVLDIRDLVIDFEQKWHATINCNRHDNSFKPDLNRIVAKVIDAICQEEEAELELAMMAYHDVAAMAHYRVDVVGDLETYNRIHLELTNLTVAFGRQIIKRFKQEGHYHHGYLPYRFRGWVGSTIYLTIDKAHTCTVNELHKELEDAKRKPPHASFSYL